MDTTDLRTFQSHPERRALLEERARTLATQNVTEIAASGDLMIRFRLGNERYALPAHCAREIQPLRAYTPLFGVPPFIVGLVNMHGRLLTCVDLRPLLDLPVSPPAPGSFLILLQDGGNELVLLADSILGMTTDALELSPAPITASNSSTSWIRGVDRDLSLVIDPGSLLIDPRLIVEHKAVA
ncbi:MAG: chemotaxis protein CheW [Roseiflexus sp.]|nr:chemotaxis protein CheW [Roseiflexus sp.]MCS7290886.1 chemotaxis protein CheW [Roseiflexus sp.]MDW8146287.1 chemotaxis protein CheW [Roseiflexaceae bacterium]MDW8232734.1 chemotaxis protein CheW [Roseiflexaceae bacterium]